MKPAVSKNVLLFLAGLVWFCVGTMLVVLAYLWLAAAHNAIGFVYFGVGVVAAWVIHRFGFQKIAAKNIKRLLPIQDKRCVFSFFTWRSYILIAVMVTLGRLLRMSPLPKPYLAILYTAIGLALALSSLKYFKVFRDEIKETGHDSEKPQSS